MSEWVCTRCQLRMPGAHDCQDRACACCFGEPDPWPGNRLFFAREHGRPPGYIDAPFLYVLGAERWAEELSRKAWIEDVRARLGLVTIDGGMPPPWRDGSWLDYLPEGGAYDFFGSYDVIWDREFTLPA